MLSIKHDENTIIDEVMQYLRECDGDEVARIYEEMSGAKCSYIDGQYECAVIVDVYGNRFNINVREVAWPTKHQSGYIILGFVPVMEPNKGEVFAVKAIIPIRTSTIQYEDYGDSAKATEYLHVCEDTYIFPAFTKALSDADVVETYLRQNSPAVKRFLECIRRNDGNYMCLNEGNKRFELYIWDDESKSVNDDGKNCIDGDIIPYYTDIERDVLLQFETSGTVKTIYSDNYIV